MVKKLVRFISLYVHDELATRIDEHVKELSKDDKISRSRFILNLVEKHLNKVEGDEKGVRSS